MGILSVGSVIEFKEYLEKKKNFCQAVESVIVHKYSHSSVVFFCGLNNPHYLCVALYTSTHTKMIHSANPVLCL